MSGTIYYQKNSKSREVIEQMNIMKITKKYQEKKQKINIENCLKKKKK